MTRLVLPAIVRGLIEPQLPPGCETHWWTSADEALAMAPGADIAWFDMLEKDSMPPCIIAATELKWLNSIYAGIDWMPLDVLTQRGTIVTSGAGINAVTIAEWVVMGMLTVAKGYADIVRAQDRREWLDQAPGRVELAGTHALILGAGAIGGLVAARLAAFEVNVTTVRRSPGPGDLGPGDWRDRLSEFDWVILAVPATPETEAMIGSAELAAMKPSAVLLNIARGAVVDQAALIDALNARRIAAAFLDVTTPEPLPAEHPLWSTPNAHITMHLSGLAQTRMFLRGAARFLDNLGRWQRGEPLIHVVDLARGY